MRTRTRLPTSEPLAARGCARSPLHALHLARAVGSARASVSRAMAGTAAAGVQAAPAFPLAEVRSSLPLEVALYFNGVYWPAFAIAELLLLVYKGARLARRSRAAATWRAARPPATIATSRRRRLSAQPRSCRTRRRRWRWRFFLSSCTPLSSPCACFSVRAISSLRATSRLLRPATTPYLVPGSRGNKTESTRPLAMSLALAVPVTVFCAYMLSLQTFVCVRPGGSDRQHTHRRVLPSLLPPTGRHSPARRAARSLRLDVVLNGIALAFVAGEVLFGAAALAAFAQHEKRS
jgi:hypothetical protein